MTVILKEDVDFTVRRDILSKTHITATVKEDDDFTLRQESFSRTH